MVEINERLNSRFMMQRDGVHELDEERFLQNVAANYAFTEGSMAVISNLRTNASCIYFGHVGETLGLGKADSYKKLDTIWEEEIFERIHPEHLSMRHLQELVFFLRMSGKEPEGMVYPWRFENTMMMSDWNGSYRKMLHRIFYFAGKAKKGICYSLCLYNFTEEMHEKARMVNMHTGERKIIDVDDCRKLLSDREKSVLLLIRNGLASKEIAEKLNISKHTVDRHRQNIIAKLQVSNSAEACHKAKSLGIIE